MVFTGQIASEDHVKTIEALDEEELERELDDCDHIYKAQRFSTEKGDELN